MDSTSWGNGQAAGGQSRGDRALTLLRTMLLNGGIVLAAMAIYYFAVLMRQQDFQDQRAFRALGEIAQQVDNKLGAIDALFSAMTGSVKQKTDIAAYESGLAIPGLTVSEATNRSRIGKADDVDAGKTFFVLENLASEPRLHAFGSLVGASTITPAPLAFSLPSRALIDPTAKLSEFDQVLIATGEGKLLGAIKRGQASAPAMFRLHQELTGTDGVVDVADLLHEARAAWLAEDQPVGASSSGAGLKPELAGNPDVAVPLAVHMAGVRFKAFVLPYKPILPIFIETSGSGPSATESAAGQGAMRDIPESHLYIIGLRKQQPWQAAAADLGSRTNWYLLLAIVAAVAFLPLLRLILLERYDAASRFHFRLLRVSLFVLTAVIALAALTALTSRKLDSQIDAAAERYAEALDAHLQTSLSSAVASLAGFSKLLDPTSKRPQSIFIDGSSTQIMIRPIAGMADACGSEEEKKKENNKEKDNDKNNDKNKDKDNVGDPYYEQVRVPTESLSPLRHWLPYHMAFEAGPNGLLSGAALTPFDCVKSPPTLDLHRREYFSVLRDGGGWATAGLWSPGVGGDTPIPLPHRYVAQRLFNKVDGDRRLQVAVPKPGPGSDFEGISSLDTSLYGLSAAVLPLFHRFAIIDTDTGSVLFHSTDDHSLVENFLLEADNNQGLAGAIASHVPGSFEGSYYGEKYRFRYRPLSYAPWGIVVMTPSDAVGDLELYGGMIAMIGYLAFTMIAVLFCALLIVPVRARMTWLYPQARLGGTYPVMIAWILLSVVSQLLLARSLAGFPLMQALLLDIGATVAAAYALLSAAPLDQSKLRRWRFVAAALCLLGVMVLAWTGPSFAVGCAVTLIALPQLAALSMSRYLLRSECRSQPDIWSRRSVIGFGNLAGFRRIEPCQPASHSATPDGKEKPCCSQSTYTAGHSINLRYGAMIGLMLVQFAVVPSSAFFLSALKAQLNGAAADQLYEAGKSFAARVAKIEQDLRREVRETIADPSPKAVRLADFPEARVIADAVGYPGLIAQKVLSADVSTAGEAPASSIDPLTALLWRYAAKSNESQARRVSLLTDQASSTHRDGLHRVGDRFQYVQPLDGGSSASFMGDLTEDAIGPLSDGTGVSTAASWTYRSIVIVIAAFALFGLVALFIKRLVGIGLLGAGNLMSKPGVIEDDREQPRATPLLIVGAVGFSDIPDNEASYGHIRAWTDEERIDLSTEVIDDSRLRRLKRQDRWLLERLDVAVLDVDRRSRALEVIESLLIEQHQRFAGQQVSKVQGLFVLVEVDPLHRLVSPELYAATGIPPLSEFDKVRWSDVLGQFNKDYLHEQETAVAVPEHWTEPATTPDELRTRIALECSLFPRYLRARGVRVALESQVGSGINSDQDVEQFVLRHARPAYLRAWLGCSIPERLVLYQLARGDIPNPLNDFGLKFLLSKGMIVMRPDPQLATGTLRRFVLGAEKPALFDEWSRVARAGVWQSVRTPLLLVVMLLVAWVAYSAGELFQAVTAVLAGTLTFLGSFTRAMGLVRGSSDAK